MSERCTVMHMRLNQSRHGSDDEDILTWYTNTSTFNSSLRISRIDVRIWLARLDRSVDDHNSPSSSCRCCQSYASFSMMASSCCRISQKSTKFAFFAMVRVRCDLRLMMLTSNYKKYPHLLTLREYARAQLRRRTSILGGGGSNFDGSGPGGPLIMKE